MCTACLRLQYFSLACSYGTLSSRMSHTTRQPDLTCCDRSTTAPSRGGCEERMIQPIRFSCRILTRSRPSNNGKYQRQYHNRAHVCSETYMLYTLYQSKDIYYYCGWAYNGICRVASWQSRSKLYLHKIVAQRHAAPCSSRGPWKQGADVPSSDRQNAGYSCPLVGSGIKANNRRHPSPSTPSCGRMCRSPGMHEAQPFPIQATHMRPKTSVSCCIEIIAAALRLVE